MTSGASTVGAIQQAIRTVPIVFVGVADPVGAGFVDSLARPGANVTGFTSYEYSMSGKWLELLKEIAPDVKRVAVLRDPTISAGTGQFGAIQTAAPSFGVELSPINVRDAAEIERDVTAFAHSGNGGLIVTTSALLLAHRKPIITLAARHKLPAVYYAGFWVTGGGLASYGPNTSTSTAAPPATLIAFSRARSPPTCRCRHRSNMCWDQSQDREGTRPHSAAVLLGRADEVIE